MERATLLGRSMFTQDDDFLEIADHWRRSGRHFTGVIYVHQLVDRGRLLCHTILGEGHVLPAVRRMKMQAGGTGWRSLRTTHPTLA
jgi:hypothetical protein